MGIASVYQEYYRWYDGPSENELDEIMNSDLSITRMWITLYGNKEIKPISNKKFYDKCIRHSSMDRSVRIVEDKKVFYCYGCGFGGTIVDLVAYALKIETEEAITILYAFLHNDLNSLNENQKEMVNKIINNYNSIDVKKNTEIIFEESKIKTDKLISRVNDCAKNYDSPEENIRKIAKRVSCTEELVKRILDISEEKKITTQEDLPFEFYWPPTMSIEDLNYEIIKIRKTGNSVRKISDGHHTFGDYIDMINELLKALCETYDIFKLELLEEGIEDDVLPFDIEYTPMSIEDINDEINKRRESGESVKEISDGKHTFGEYIDMRNKMFIALCEANNNISWKSKKYFDEVNDPMYDGDFIAGINTPDGVITFHLKLKYWDELNIKEIDNSPKYDGYTKEDVKKRIKSLYKQN